MIQGADLLATMLKADNDYSPDLRAWMLHAIAQAHGADKQQIDTVWNDRSRLTPQGLALLGTALLRQNDSRAAEVAQRLQQLAVKDNQGARWSCDRDLFESWSRDAGVEATGFALRFLALQNASNPLLPEVARWLAASRDNGPAWATTKRTAFALYGLTEYLRVSKELQPSFQLTVTAGGKTLLDKSFSSSDVFAAPPQIEAPAGVPISIRKSGAGTAYVSLDGTARLAGDRLEMPRTGSGFKIARELFRLTPQSQNGKIVYRLEPLTGSVTVGETGLVRVTVSALADQRYLLIDAPLPAGAEPIEHDGIYEISPQPPWWTWSWARRELRDSHALWYPWRIFSWNNRTGGEPEGVYSAMIRFTNAGSYRIGAARVEAMYQPGLFRATEQITLEVVGQ